MPHLLHSTPQTMSFLPICFQLSGFFSHFYVNIANFSNKNTEKSTFYCNFVTTLKNKTSIVITLKNNTFTIFFIKNH